MCEQPIPFIMCIAQDVGKTSEGGLKWLILVNKNRIAVLQSIANLMQEKGGTISKKSVTIIEKFPKMVITNLSGNMLLNINVLVAFNAFDIFYSNLYYNKYY